MEHGPESVHPQKDTGANRFPIPSGLRSLLEAVAREVIRNQPNDVYAFTALFFDKILEFRIKNNVNPIENAEFYDKFKDELQAEACKKHMASARKLISGDAALRCAGIAKSQQKPISAGHLASPDIAATKIQAAARGFITRRKVGRHRNALEEARQVRAIRPDAYDPRRPVIRKPQKSQQPQAPPPTVLLSKTSTDKGSVDEDDPVKDKAATKIQAGVRGFLARRRCSRIRLEQNKAATVIQAGARGFLTRRHLEAEGIPVHPPSRSPSPSSKQRLSMPTVVQERRHSNDLDNLNLKAAKIQAGIRGYLTRKHMEAQGLKVRHPDKSRSRSQSPGLSNAVGTTATTIATEMISGIPKLPEAAASKIEAGVREFLTKKHQQNEQNSEQQQQKAESSPDRTETNGQQQKQGKKERRSPSATKIPVFVSSPHK